MCRAAVVCSLVLTASTWGVLDVTARTHAMPHYCLLWPLLHHCQAKVL